MAAADSEIPAYPVYEVLAKPFPERIRLISRMWAAQIHATPIAVVAMYWFKYLFVFIGAWAFFCSFNVGYAGFWPITEWAFTAAGFQKAIVWAILYESLGIGCSSGPMNARFWPPIGGFLHQFVAVAIGAGRRVVAAQRFQRLLKLPADAAERRSCLLHDLVAKGVEALATGIGISAGERTGRAHCSFRTRLPWQDRAARVPGQA